MFFRQLFKWARAGDSNKLKTFLREQQQTKEFEIKEFLNWADDGKHDVQENETEQEKGGCCGGNDDDEFAIPKFQPYRNGNTALHYAALHANAEFCKDLFELGAKFSDVKNKFSVCFLLVFCIGVSLLVIVVLKKTFPVACECVCVCV